MQKLQLHNTLSRKLEDFKPQSDTVKLYTCGPTVYDYLHVGNWAAYIYWDTLVRVLTACGYEVERVMNITDVGHLVSDADDGEDKMEKGARREGKTAWEVAEYYTQDFLNGMKLLGLLPPEHLAKATDYIDEQLELVRVLKQKGFTYQTSDGIYFDTEKFPAYADFAKLSLDQQKAGARVDFGEKRHISDFALWKFTPVGTTRDMEWETPDDLVDLPGEEKLMGFPGWHLECSAIAMKHLGNTLDIHTGGIDHIPVHHTNEIAQSQAATDTVFSNYWLHNNHIKSEGVKISKSLQNGFTLKDIIEKGFSPMEYRMFILQSQYQNEGNFTWENLTAAKNHLHNWRNYAVLRHQTHSTLDDLTDTNPERTSLLSAPQALLEALSNNLNTPEGIRVIDGAFNRLDNIPAEKIDRQALVRLIENIDQLFGLDLLKSTPDIADEDKKLILERQRVREDKDWSKSDELRDELAKKGIALRDTSHGTIWRYV